MKKGLVLSILAVLCLSCFTGCDTEANRVNYNITQEADNFNTVRQITVINCITGDVLFQMTGNMSITADIEDQQLEIIVEDGEGTYKKHFIGLSDNVTYVIEDITDDQNVSKYQYTLNFNPNMILPYDVDTID